MGKSLLICTSPANTGMKNVNPPIDNGCHRPVLATRRRFFTAPIRYIVNGISTFNLSTETLLQIAGDIKPNPGPENNQGKFRPINFPEKGLRIGQWNVNCLTDTKFEQIKLLLLSANSVDVLFLIETFLKPTSPDCIYEIPGYCLFRKDRHGSKHSGRIIAYSSQNLDVKRAEELEEDDLEIIWLNVNPFNSKRTLLCGAMYRPPSTNAATDTRLELNIESAYLKNKEIHILGDFNIDYLKQPICNNHQLPKALKSMQLVQVVKSV